MVRADEGVFGVARSWGKGVFRDHAKLYGIAKRAFVLVRVLADHAIFKVRHRDAKYVRYSGRKLSAFHASGFTSQYGQDYYLWNVVLRAQASGFFVDIGGNDPATLSNSLFLERQGWDGIAFDPLRQMEGKWAQQRKAKFHRVAISDSISERTFVEILPSEGWEHTLSGFADFVRREDMNMYGYDEYLVPTAPLSRFVDAGQAIDLVLIDVEGAEREVLAGLALRRHRPHYLLVENISKLGGDDSIRCLVTDEGYRLIARIGAADDLFEIT